MKRSTLKFRNLLIFCLTVFALLINGCAKIPPTVDLNSSAIAITIDVDIYKNPLNMQNLKPETVYFIKLDNETDSILKDNVIASNFKYESLFGNLKDGGVDSFLMNVPAGTYAAVAVSGLSGGNSPFSGGGNNGQVVFFSKEAIKKSIVTVEPGAMVYMGDFVFNRVAFWSGMKKSDECQKHYFNIVGKGSFMGQPYAASVKNIENSNDVEKSFLKGHESTFKKTGWIVKLEKRLNQI